MAASAASWTLSIAGFNAPVQKSAITWRNSSMSPIVEPTRESWFQNRRARSVTASGPVVVPQVTKTPPRASDLTQARWTALPTESAQTSTPRLPVMRRTSRDQSSPVSSTP